MSASVKGKQKSRFNPEGGGDSAYERGWDAHKKF